VQLHWWRQEPLLSQLLGNDFAIVTLARHPFDVMMSALNYTYYSHDGRRCAVENCWSCLIRDATPRSNEFRRYVQGWPGQNTLSYSPTWWTSPETLQVRYEDLVADTIGVLGHLANSLGWPLDRSLEEAAADYDKEVLRAYHDVWHYHYWQGRPGLWRELLPALEAAPLFSSHRDVFDCLEYAYDPDPNLDPVTADLNWYRLQHSAMRKHLRDERDKHAATRALLDEARSQTEADQGQSDLVGAPRAESVEVA
jgi:hypothetical protein